MLLNRAGRSRVSRHVANMWQDDQPRPTGVSDSQRVFARQPQIANNLQPHLLSVPRFPGTTDLARLCR